MKTSTLANHADLGGHLIRRRDAEPGSLTFANFAEPDSLYAATAAT